MKSLNDVLWNKDGEAGKEKGKDNEQHVGQPPMLTDNCACAYGSGCPGYGSGVFAAASSWCW